MSAWTMFDTTTLAIDPAICAKAKRDSTRALISSGDAFWNSAGNCPVAHEIKEYFYFHYNFGIGRRKSLLTVFVEEGTHQICRQFIEIMRFETRQVERLIALLKFVRQCHQSWFQSLFSTRIQKTDQIV